MKKTKRLLAMFVIFLLLSSSVPVSVFAAGVSDPWTFSAFGGNTSPGKNPEPTVVDPSTVTLSTYGGKIAGSDEGLSYYFKELPADTNFELKAKATVETFNSRADVSTPNQKSFGIMLRDTVGTNGSATTTTSNYVAAGALDTVMKGFYKKATTQTKLTTISGSNPPATGEVYDLSIVKSGDIYVLSINGQSTTETLKDMFTGTLFAGIYVSRDATVTFSELDIQVANKVTSIEVVSPMTKTSYLVGEAIDLTGLVVEAQFEDNTKTILSSKDYIVTGFNSSKVGPNIVTITYNGSSVSIPIQIEALTMTSLIVKYEPAKTIYYPNDSFDSTGLVITGDYNNGLVTKDLTSDLYSLSINGTLVTDQAPYVFTQSGTYEVILQSVESPTITTTFNIEVMNVTLSKLEIRTLPKQTLYYIGDTIKLEGLVLHANYSDGSQIRLLKDEYTVSPLDSMTPGDKQITVTHKGVTATFTVKVKVKELVGIEVTSYPKTTFFLNDAFDSTNLVVSKVYDSSDREVLHDLTLDTSKFDNTQPGNYDIGIIPTDSSITPISYQVSVMEEPQPVWNSIIFGTSISSAKNKINKKDNGTIELIAQDGGGKITEDQDGISFYYTELDASAYNFVLSADIEVLEFGKPQYDGQESFGIMARDAIGTAGNSSIFASNIAAIGGYSGGTKNAIGTQLFVRSGVNTPDGAGSKGLDNIMLKNERPSPANTVPKAPYRLTLSKTNSGFKGQLNNKEEAFIFEPDILNVQDSKMYIGFFVARLATINVSNIQLTVTSAVADAPKVDPPVVPVSPSLSILSLTKTSSPEYQMILRPNVSGTVTVKQGSKVIAQDIEAKADTRLSIPATLTAKGDTNFSITFLPDDFLNLTSYDKIIQNFTVTMNSYGVEGGNIYVSPTGTPSGDGTKELPLDLDTAIEYVNPGQHIIVLDGHYVRQSPLNIKKYNDGTAAAKKYLEAAPGARPVIDFDKKSEGVLLSGNYWHVKGLDFTRSANNTKGFTVGGNYNIVENSNFYANGDTGLQISRTDGTAQDITEWPSYNLILNSTSFDNRDPSDNNADGFAAKLTSGVGNIFRGCLAHNNIDDGWDLYTKAGSGAIGPVLIENSAAFNNGYLTNGTVGAGDKNGFKLGGEGIHVHHVIRNSIAFGNGAYGFTSNSNPGVIAIDNIGFNNTRGNLSFTTYDQNTPDFTTDGFISYATNSIGKDQYPASLAADNNYMFDGTVSANKSGTKLTNDNFVSLNPVSSYTRDAEGNVIWGDFLKFIPFEKPDPTPTPTSTATATPTPTPTAIATPSPTATSSPSTSNSGSGVQVQASPDTTLLLDGSVRIELPLAVNAGKAKATLTEASLQQIITLAKVNAAGDKKIQIQLTGDQTANLNEYEVNLPATAFRTGVTKLQLEINSSLARVALQDNAFPTDLVDKAKTVTIILKQVAAEGKLKEQLGKNTLLAYELRVDGASIPAGTLKSAIQIGLPYSPAVPAVNNAFITVWKIDENGVIVPVLNGNYDTDKKQAIFLTVNSSGQYAAVYNHKSFQDLSTTHWAKFNVEVLASKGIINGMSPTEFKPEQSISRADFVLLLIRGLGLKAPEGKGFADVSSNDYYYEGLMTAQKLGIVTGQPDGLYHPNASITRQEMFVMAVRALKAAEEWKSVATAPAALDGFKDYKQIAEYAAEDIASLVATGLIKGDAGQKLNPTAATTRAEAAMLIYRMLTQ